MNVTTLLGRARRYAHAISALPASWRRAALGIVAVLIALFIFRDYFGVNGLLFGDANFLWTPSLLHAELQQFVHVWRPAQTGGMSGAIADASQDYLLFQALLSPFGTALSQVLVFPLLLLCGFFTFYRFARELRADRMGAALAALFFVGNPWIWDQILTGHIAITAAVCASPIVFYALTKLYRGNVAFGFLLLAAAALELALDPRISLFVFGGLALAAVGGFLRLRGRGGMRSGLIFAAFALAAPVFAALCNGSWTLLYAFVRNANLVPFFYPPVEDTISYSAFSDLGHTLALSGYFIHFSWTRAESYGGTVLGIWYVASVLVLVAAVFTAPRRRAAVRLGLLAVAIGLLLSMGSHGLPLWVLYWLYSHVPLMSLLREPIKFGYVAAFGIATLLALAFATLSRRVKALVALAVVIVIFPIFTGRLSVPDGHGFQDFTARAGYTAMLDFFEQQRRSHGDFRIAVLPPWLAEQSLEYGEFYTANPFVIQSEIPVIDAKLINTANLTTQQSWRAFYGMYWGTDTHPAATLATLGVKYVVVPRYDVLSPGAATTSFAHADRGFTLDMLARDPAFVAVYNDSGNLIFENREFRSLYRTARLPIVAGAIPAALRQALPTQAFGDSFAAGTQPQALPAGSRSIAESPLARCIDEHGELPVQNAYWYVTKHNDYTGYWVASDWLLTGPDDYRGRILQRFPLPFAYTEALSSITVPVTVRSRSEVYAEVATVGAQGVVQGTIDRAPSHEFVASPERLDWFDLGTAERGTHNVVITGSPAGTVLRRIVVDSGTCSGKSPAVDGRGDAYFLPGPTRDVRIDVGPTSTRVAVTPMALGGTRLNPPAQSIKTPPGAAAILWDETPVPMNQSFSSMTGLHRLRFLAPDGNPLNGAWTISNRAPYQANGGTSVAAAGIRLVGGRWPQRAQTVVENIGDNQMTIVHFSTRGSIPGARVSFGSADNASMSFDVNQLRDRFIAVPYYGASYAITVTTPPNATGTLSVTANARIGTELGDRQTIALPVAAERIANAPLRNRGLKRLASYVLRDDGILMRKRAAIDDTAIAGEEGLVLHLSGIRAATPARALVRAFYRTPVGTRTLTIADIALDPVSRDQDIPLPVEPLSESIALSITSVPGTTAAMFLHDAELRSGDSRNGGTIVHVPAMHVSGGVPVAADSSAIESIPFENVRGRYFVGSFTYDPDWHVDSKPHWLVNSFANGWDAPGKNAIEYGLQALYIKLLLFGALLWTLSLALFVVVYRRGRTA